MSDETCEHKRKRVESPTEFRERVDRGEDPNWIQSWCSGCGALFLTASERQQKREFNHRSPQMPSVSEGEDRESLRRAQLRLVRSRPGLAGGEDPPLPADTK